MREKGIASFLLLVLLAAAGIIVYLLITNFLPFQDKKFSTLYPKPSAEARGRVTPTPTPSTRNIVFSLYTRVTDVTWPQIQPYAQDGDVFWGKVESVPAGLRAFTFPSYSILASRFTDSEALKYSSINLDGEYSDFNLAYQEAQQIRTFIDSYNQRQYAKNPNFKPYKFIAFYHLNIINAHPDIVKYPDVVLIGKTNWSPTEIIQNGGSYATQIKNAGRAPGILLGAYSKGAGTTLKTPAETYTEFQAVVNSPTQNPPGLGLKIAGYYYGSNDDSNLLYLLQTSRPK